MFIRRWINEYFEDVHCTQAVLQALRDWLVELGRISPFTATIEVGNLLMIFVSILLMIGRIFRRISGELWTKRPLRRSSLSRCPVRSFTAFIILPIASFPLYI